VWIHRQFLELLSVRVSIGLSKNVVYLRKHYIAVIGSKCDNAQFMLWPPGLS
jgi:hypothetical protein